MWTYRLIYSDDMWILLERRNVKINDKIGNIY